MSFGEISCSNYSESPGVKFTHPGVYGCERYLLFFTASVSLILHILVILVVSTAVAISSDFILYEDSVLHVSLVSDKGGGKTEGKNVPEIKDPIKKSTEMKGKMDEHPWEIKSIEDLQNNKGYESKSLRVMEVPAVKSNIAVASIPSRAMEEDLPVGPHGGGKSNVIVGNSHGEDISLALPRYRKHTQPVYPRVARIQGYEGLVLVSVEVFSDGKVGNVRMVKSSGYEVLDKSALEAVKTWRFEPGRKMGQHTTMWVDIPIKFVLKDRHRM